MRYFSPMKLNEFLSQNKITQERFAELIGVEQPTVCRYLKNERFPREDEMRRIYTATNGLVTPNDFIDLSP